MQARFSANLGFLWSQLALPEAVARAHAAGFSAVECHWPYAVSAAVLRAALNKTGLPLLAINTRKGDFPGDVGTAAVPGREREAIAAIDEALSYASAVGARAVHVMAGIAPADEPASSAFAASLAHACRSAAVHGLTILIEPLNRRDVPGYFLSSLDQAVAIVERVGAPNLKIMFDCYHMQITHGDLLHRFQAHRDMIGHVQFAAVPSRAEPDEGEVSYERLLPAIVASGYDGFFGAEYTPRATVEEGLGWLSSYRRSE